jgi:Tfp pilus assembly protein PilF
MTAIIDNFLKMLAAGKDSAMLRFSLGSQYLKQNETVAAVEHLRQAVGYDPGYSAAWKLLGKALEAGNRADEALNAYRSGIAAAEQKGDIQAAKEMTVFAKRIEKRQS